MYSYYLIVILSLVLGMAVSSMVNGRMKKYRRIGVSTGLTGREAALKMLYDNGVNNVSVVQGREGMDHFDPRTNTIALSPSNFNSRSLTATATAYHEAGHALQYATNYRPLFIRSSMAGTVNFCSNAWIFVFLIGVSAQLSGLTMLACLIYAFVVFFQVVTLPVEFNASSRALSYAKSLGMSSNELSCSKKLLTACALTYVVAALTAIIQLIWIYMQADR